MYGTPCVLCFFEGESGGGPEVVSSFFGFFSMFFSCFRSGLEHLGNRFWGFWDAFRGWHWVLLGCRLDEDHLQAMVLWIWMDLEA